jgi:hypothetical protein
MAAASWRGTSSVMTALVMRATCRLSLGFYGGAVLCGVLSGVELSYAAGLMSQSNSPVLLF